MRKITPNFGKGFSCARCNRVLTNPESVKIGLGPVCVRKMKRNDEGHDEDGSTIADIPFDFETWDVVCKRVPNGRTAIDGQPLYRVSTNINQAVVWHSPTGFEWGYGGSGPADFALNILHWFVPPKKGGKAHDFPVEVSKGSVTSAFASRYHQDFKRYVAAIPHEGGIIKGDLIKAYIKEKIAEFNSQDLY